MRRWLSVACLIALAGCHSDNLLSPDVVTFTAKSIVNPNPSYFRVPTPTIETTITMTNTSDRVYSIKAQSGDCGFTFLKVFATSDRSGSPVWRQPSPVECLTIGSLPSPLNPGESRQFMIGVRVSDVLGPSLPSGAYYVDAVVSYFSKQIEGKSLTTEVDGGTVELAR